MPARDLDRVVERVASVAAEDALPLVVFDLDSTLFSTAPRNLRILREFAQHYEHEGLTGILPSIGLEDMGWNVPQIVAERGVDDEELLGALRSFWFERFFTDEYCAGDDPTPGAADFVNRCHQAGAMIYYLSGRHVGGMEYGTVQSLVRHGFPYWRGRCVVHLKPSFEMADKAFKDEALEDIRSYHGRVVATFENEPGNANLFLAAFPEATHFLLETVCSPEAETPAAALVRLADFA